MHIVCFDLEGILTPEVWINVALKTGIDELKLTTRDISDYNVLMKRRLEILRENKITLKKIQEIIAGMNPLPGAKEFLDWIRSVTQIIIVSDSYIEFVPSLMKKLNYPTIFCHNLEIDNDGMISNYKLRANNMKRETVLSFKNMNYDVIAVGDSYNDIEMLFEAKYGILFRAPKNVMKEFPQFPVVNEYFKLKKILSEYLGLSE
jgi:phosphoserine/homoserine phosphotransferase